MEFPVCKYGLVFRLVDESDASFILSLRADPKLSRHLSPTDNNLPKQIMWIRDYKRREAKGEEYYILFQDQSGEKLGVLRIYKIVDNTFNYGSWLIKPKSDELVAIKSDLFVSSFAFDDLKFDKCFIDVRKENKKVLNYHKKFFTHIGEDGDNYYFVMDKEGYKRKYQFLTSLLL